MTEVTHDPPRLQPSRDPVETAIQARLATLDDRRRALVLRFVEQIVLCHDPDVVEDFLAWRSDPTIESLLQLAAAASGEMREQLLFAAEDLYSHDALRH